MSLFDRIVVASIPLVPRALVRKVARRYVAGETLQDAIAVARSLAAEGAMATLDVLGESVTRPEQTEAARDEYLRALDAIAASGLAANTSVKPTAVGLSIDPDLARRNLAAICRKAAGHGIFVRLDMEDTPFTEKTIRLALDLKAEFGNVGTVLQACLRRSLADLARLGEAKMNVRICKGIYNEPRELAYKGHDVVVRNYADMVERHLGAGGYAAIATHDEACIQAALATIDRLSLQADAYEFQMLLGVDPLLRRVLISSGHRLRVYVPYGRDWYAYSTRRLRENPAIARHIVNALLGMGPSGS
jgi:proline dehydrogenase